MLPYTIEKGFLLSPLQESGLLPLPTVKAVKSGHLLTRQRSWEFPRHKEKCDFEN